MLRLFTKDTKSITAPTVWLLLPDSGKRQYAVVPIAVYNDLLEKAELSEDRAAYEKAT